jgi:hypothetical protein
MAIAMGFSGTDAFFGEASLLIDALRASEPLTAKDWERVLLATEIVFVSDIVGAGSDWEAVIGLSDGETLRILRRLQEKIIAVR